MRITKLGASGTIPESADVVIIAQKSGTITLTMPPARLRGTKKITILRDATCAATIEIASKDANGAIETLAGKMNNPAIWAATQRRCSYVVVDKQWHMLTN